MLHDCYSVNTAGHLCVGGVDCVELAAEFGTPLYVLDADKVRQRCRVYAGAMRDFFPVGSMPYFASKALCFVDIYKIIASEGLGTDIVSPGELYTARAAGFPLNKTCFHGNNKTDADIKFGLECGVGYFIVDNFEELYALDRLAGECGRVQDILLRLTPGIDPHTLKAINTGRVDSKFGSAIATGAAEAITKAALTLSNVRLRGYHCHIGSQIFESEPFCRAGSIMLEYSAFIKEKYGYEAEIINLGGGFGVRYIEEHPKIDVREFIKEISASMNEVSARLGVKMPVVFMEPGRGIVAAAGVTLYTVGSRKEIPGFKNYISIDGGMTDDPRYALYASQYTVLIADKMNEPCDYRCTVGGRCCESGDLIAEDIYTQKADRGDVAAVLVTGAYNYSMASNYNRIPRPALVIVEGGQARLSVRRESYEDLIRNEV